MMVRSWLSTEYSVNGWYISSQLCSHQNTSSAIYSGVLHSSMIPAGPIVSLTVDQAQTCGAALTSPASEA